MSGVWVWVVVGLGRGQSLVFSIKTPLRLLLLLLLERFSVPDDLVAGERFLMAHAVTVFVVVRVESNSGGGGVGGGVGNRVQFSVVKTVRFCFSLLFFCFC